MRGKGYVMLAEDWLRGCVNHDGRNGYVTLPCDEVLEIADYIESTRNKVEVVRCRDCKWWEHTHGSFGRCSYEYWDEDGRFRTYIERFCDDYCSDGERKE